MRLLEPGLLLPLVSSLSAAHRIPGPAFVAPAPFRPPALAQRIRGGGSSRPLQMAASDPTKDPMHVVQRQLEEYNKRDVESFLKLFSDDCTLVDLQTGQVLATGKDEIRPRYVSRFASPVHCVVTGRLSIGRVVTDREFITGLPDGGEANVLAVYQVNEEGLINRVQFVWEPVVKK